MFEVPVTADDEPGIFISAHFVRNGELYQSTKRMKVPPVEHQLNVKLSTDKPQYLPGETRHVQHRCYGRGRQAGGARGLQPGCGGRGHLRDPAATRRRTSSTSSSGMNGTRCSTENSLNYYFNGEAGKRRMRLAELRPRARLAQLKPERLVQPKIRKAFPDTAFWAADVIDRCGRARAGQSAIPGFADHLARDGARRHRRYQSRERDSQDHRAQEPDPAAGRSALLRAGRRSRDLRDRAQLPDRATRRRVFRSTSLGSMFWTARRTMCTFPSRGEVKVDWRVRAQQVRSATITGKALTDEESDALATRSAGESARREAVDVEGRGDRRRQALRRSTSRSRKGRSRVRGR